MTKQPPSVTKSHLSRLFRCLGVFCLLKLCLLGLLLADVRLLLAPGDTEAPAGHETASATGKALVSAPTTRESSPPADVPLPAPSARAETFSAADRHAQPSLILSADSPPALPLPQAEPGTDAPAPGLLLASAPKPAPAESGWMDALGISRLPIPRLGSVQAAHAAALDMPVPQTPGRAQSPFAPAAQNQPVQNASAPLAAEPRNDNAPLPLRPRGAGGDAAIPSLPGAPAAVSPPAPATGTRSVAPSPEMTGQDLNRQQQDILTLRKQMDQRLKEMEATEKKVKDMIREARGLEEDKVRRLILTYTQMKPKAAAKALESMEERVAIRILSGMSPKQSGDILTYVNPEKTAKLTELITRMRLPE